MSAAAAAAAARSQANAPAPPRGDMAEPLPPTLEMEVTVEGGDKVYYEKMGALPDSMMDLFRKMDKESV
eukprot:3989440-Amphidinium_carterae.1